MRMSNLLKNYSFLKSVDIFEVVGTGFYMATREFNFAQIHFDAISK